MQRRPRQIHPTDLKMKAIGTVVREFRERAGHSQERLSGECGFDRTYISRVERGIINPTVGRLWKIADALKTPLSQLTRITAGMVLARTLRSARQIVISLAANSLSGPLPGRKPFIGFMPLNADSMASRSNLEA